MKKFGLIYQVVATSLVILLTLQNYKLKQLLHETRIQENRLEIPIDNAPVLGPMDAPVTLVVFSAFACEYCADAAKVLDRIHQQFPTEVRIVYRHFAIGDGARMAALLAMAAQEQDMFWEMHDLLFASAPDFTRAMDPERFPAGLNREKFKQDMTREELTRRIDQDYNSALSLGVDGTPTLFVNGRMVTGIQYNTLEALVKGELVRKNNARS